MSLLLIYAFF